MRKNLNVEIYKIEELGQGVIYHIEEEHDGSREKVSTETLVELAIKGVNFNLSEELAEQLDFIELNYIEVAEAIDDNIWDVLDHDIEIDGFETDIDLSGQLLKTYKTEKGATNRAKREITDLIRFT